MRIRRSIERRYARYGSSEAETYGLSAVPFDLRGRYGLRASDTAWKPAPFRGKLFSLLRMVTGKYPGYPLRITMK